MAKKKKTSLVAVRQKAKKPRALDFGQDYAEAYIDRMRPAGERRQVVVWLATASPDELREAAEFCKQAADWMEDEK